MGSIIGATHLIKYKRKAAKPSKATGGYKRRNDLLPEIGYASYPEYLASEDWKRIREKVLRKYPDCCCCDQRASEVHHFSYEARVLLGLWNEMLFPICDGCHKKVEFLPDGSKRFFDKARTVLIAMLKPFYLNRFTNGLLRGKRLRKQANKAWKAKNRSRRGP